MYVNITLKTESVAVSWFLFYRLQYNYNYDQSRSMKYGKLCQVKKYKLLNYV